MKVGLRNHKGFTLIEIMIVIAIIGILALILVPKAMQMKENAKVAGVEANMRVIASQIELVLDDYPVSTTTSNGSTTYDLTTPANGLRDELIRRLDNTMKNPFTGSSKVLDYANNNDFAAVKVNADVTMTATESDNRFAKDGSNNTTDLRNNAGTVIISIHKDSTNSNRLEVSIYGYKEKKSGNHSPGDGEPITPKSKVKETRITQ